MFRLLENLVDPYVDYEETDAPPRTLVAFLMAYSKPFMRVFAIAGIVSIIIAVIELWLIGYMGRMVDQLGANSPAAVWQAHGWEFIAMAVFVLTIRPVFQVLGMGLLHNTIMVNYGTLIRWRTHRQVLRQSVGWFENDFAGRIANRIMQTPPAANEVVFQLFDAVSYAVAYVVGSAVLLSDADPILLVPLAIWLALYVVEMIWVIRKVEPASEASSEARSKLTGRVVDSYTNIHAVKMFAHQGREIDYAREAIEETRQTVRREMRLYTLMDAGLVMLNGFLMVSVVGWAIWLWMGGIVSVGAVAAATALVLRLNAMTGWIMWAVTNLFRNMGVVREGMDTIAQPVTLVDSPGAAELLVPDGKIEICGLTHHYGREQGGLAGIDLTIAPGEKVGLVGRSGAGKTTLVKLLLRFYDVEGGSIAIDGQNIAEVTQDSLRRAIGMVQQEGSLLHRSVRDNILYGRPEASEEEMMAAAKQAEAHDFIATLEDSKGNKGYDALVGERGVKLSGGQRQRIVLARVMLKDAPILVLDEATSALDSEVEAAIQDTLYGLMQGKTVIAIAHRLSTIAQMDKVVVMDEGRIVETGSHAELLEQGGIYAGLWARQSGGFLGEAIAEVPDAAKTEAAE